MPESEPSEPPAELDRHASRYDPLAWDAVRVVTVAVLSCVAVTVTVLVIYLVSYASSQRETQQCLQAQFDELQTSYLAARSAGAQDRQAQRELLLAQLATPMQGREAVQRYLARLDDADRGRSAAPPPTLRCI